MSGGLADAGARLRIRSALDATLVVEAAAGTGKTTELVHRLVAVLAAGTDVGRIVAVTFTDKAAGELKLRLRSGLESARKHAEEGPRREALARALAHLEEARIQTIHGFCADLLRERPVEARIDPRFELLGEGDARSLFDETFSRWVTAALAAPPEGLRRALRRRGREGPLERLRAAAEDLRAFRHLPAPWRREPFERDALADALVRELFALADLTDRAASPRDRLFCDTKPIRDVAARLRRAELSRRRDHDEVEAEICRLAAVRDAMTPRKGSGKSYGDGLSREEVLAAVESFRAHAEEFRTRADADLAALLQRELGEVVARYEADKARTGRLDFEDLLLRARDLLRDSRAARADFQARFDRIFVDEFQDTDPLQADILLLLAASDPDASDPRAVAPVPGKLFVVGDPKQAIYRFRRADLAIYERVKRQLVAAGAEHVELTTSFRSVPAIQKLVNAAFAPRMPGDDGEGVQAAYVPLAAARESAPAQAAVVALPVPSPYGKQRLSTKSVKESIPDAVAAFVDWLVHESGVTVTDPERPKERVPIAARHVCLLFRNLTSFGDDVARPFARALEGRGIPHVLVGGRSLHAREEAQAVLAALTAIEWPDDALHVYATLRGPLFSLSDDALLAYADVARGGGEDAAKRRLEIHPMRRFIGPLSDATAAVRDALALLAELHRARNRRPVAETIGALLEATRAHAAFALWPSGEQALANVLYLVDLARAYEHQGGLSFRGFLERMRERAERGAPEAPILEEASDGVRMMTVHKAKGLEFPVVVIADPTTMPRRTASRHVDAAAGLAAIELAGCRPWELIEHEEEELRHDRAESVRLAYVAATRPRDLLVVPVVGDAPRFPEGSWIDPLLAALAPADPKGPAKAPGCPPFGPDSVLERPPELAAGPSTVVPGLHVLAGGAEVVYWDPRALPLDREPLVGVRRDELLREPARAVVDEDLAAYAAFRAERAATLGTGARPSLVVDTATARAGDEAAEVSMRDVALVEVPRATWSRPSGKRFGTLVHATLAEVALDADDDVVARVAALEGRVLGATEIEVVAAADLARAALAHPLFARARAAAAQGLCRRETPLAMVGDDGALVEGIVDLAFFDEGAWTVVDFKTDISIAHELERYRRQVSLYAQAIERATGQSARGALLWL